MTEVAVIIPHYNDVVRLMRCLDALAAQVGSNATIIVADNNSTADLASVKRHFPEVIFVREYVQGAGPARNRGVAETDARWLLFIDSDCVPASNWVEYALSIAKEGTVIGGRVDIFHEDPPPLSGAQAFEEVFAFKMQAYLERDGFLGSGNLVTSRTVFDTVGGFRGAVSEDTDWSARAVEAGFRLQYDNNLVVGHPSRSDWMALRNKWRRITSERYLLLNGTGRDRLKWALRALLMVPSAIAHTPRVLRCPELALGEKLRALATLFRLRGTRMMWMLGQAATGRS